MASEESWVLLIIHDYHLTTYYYVREPFHHYGSLAVWSRGKSARKGGDEGIQGANDIA